MEPISVEDQIFNVIIRCHPSVVCFLSIVYAFSYPMYRTDLWNYLVSLSSLITLPWIILGDFNQVSNVSEKKGGRPPNSQGMQQFNYMIFECALPDMGFVGPRFTWSNMREGPTLIQECLDNALYNRQFLTRYLEYTVVHLPRPRSDHHPLLVSTPDNR